MSKQSNIPASPINIPIFETNRGGQQTKSPELSNSEKLRKLYSSISDPGTLFDLSGHYEGFVVEKGRLVKTTDLPPSIKNSYQNTDHVMVVKVYVIELNRTPHFEEKIIGIDGKEIEPNFLNSLVDDFISADEISQTEWPDVGDRVYVDYDDRRNMQGGRYYGMKFKASANSGATNPETPLKEQDKKNKTELSNASSPPANGKMAPDVTTPSPAVPGELQDCGPFIREQKTPGVYPVTVEPGELEMIIVPGTATFLYPKKYVRAFTTMNEAYKQYTKNLYGTERSIGITSAYRSVNLQACMFHNYQIKKKLFQEGKLSKMPAKTAPPGESKHNSGIALDLNTGSDYNDKFEKFGFSQSQSQQAKDLIRDINSKNGGFGEVAKWLVENSENFGFRWTGYFFKELWHYELNVSDAMKKGLID